jgi:hypothetical protein
MEDSIYSFGKLPNSGMGATYDFSKFGRPSSPSVEELYAPTNSLYSMFNSGGGNGTGFGAQGGMGLQAPNGFGNLSGISKAMPASGNWFKDSGFLGGKNIDGSSFDGWGGTAISAGQGLLSAFMGMKQYGLAKKTLAHNKDVFNKNYDAQKRTTNASLEDRQKARLDRNSNNESVESYMNKNGIK